MVGDYQVYFGNQPCGKVQVRRQGLYYRFTCRCRLTGDALCRLLVSVGTHQENLGVLVPVEGGFGLDTRIAAKRFGEGTPSFTVVSSREQMQERFVPITPEEPFAYIERLKTSFLVRKYGKLGILLTEEPAHREISSPTGQWSEPKTSQ